MVGTQMNHKYLFTQFIWVKGEVHTFQKISWQVTCLMDFLKYVYLFFIYKDYKFFYFQISWLHHSSPKDCCLWEREGDNGYLDTLSFMAGHKSSSNPLIYFRRIIQLGFKRKLMKCVLLNNLDCTSTSIVLVFSCMTLVYLHCTNTNTTK